MYKHVSLLRRQMPERTSWTLLGPDGFPVDAFTAFAESLRHAPSRTRESYCRHLAEFFDYFIEATLQIGGGQPLTKLQLTETLEAYGDYLLLGTDGSKPIARAVAAALHPGANKATSVIPKKAVVRRFLRMSEDIRKEMVELARIFDDGPKVATAPLFAEGERRRQLHTREISAMQEHSMFAGVVAGGPKLIASVILNEKAGQVQYDNRRAFPYDKVIDLIEEGSTYRDKALYALLAASGCRTHEALQVLLSDDIDVEGGTLRLVDPMSRPGHSSYRALTVVQREKLAWKGRTSDITLLIEPFASAFFENLHRYLEHEYIAHGKHDFLFQYPSGKRRGVPYFLSSAESRLETFHSACGRIGVILPRGCGLHSLRHMYGTYALNYFPRSNGEYGLPVPVVQQLLGHSDVRATLKYARLDEDVRKLEIQNANRVLFQRGTPKNLLQLKIEALEAQLARTRLQLSEGNSHD